MRNLIRRWLGVPTRAEVRKIAQREIDADRAWRYGSTQDEREIEAARIRQEREARRGSEW